MPAMKLELMDYSGILEYQSEHVLNTKALQIDLLVIKKDSNVVLKNEIGRMFRCHNIIEYKSPHDSEGMDEYIKTHAYASLYKINENGSVPYSLEDITITMIREGKPVRLFAWFDNRGCTIKETYYGVYHIENTGFFETQVIVSRELDDRNHVWLRTLTDSMDREQAKHLLRESGRLVNRPEANLVDAVLQVASKANRKIFDEIKKEDRNMYSALVELMQPEIDEAVDKRVGKAVSEAVEKTRSETWDKASSITAAKMTVEAIDNVMRKLSMSKEEACALMDITSKQYDAYQQLVKNAQQIRKREVGSRL